MTNHQKLLAELKAARVAYGKHTQQMEQGYGSHAPMTEGHVLLTTPTEPKL